MSYINNNQINTLRQFVISQKVNQEAMQADRGYAKEYAENQDLAIHMRKTKGHKKMSSNSNWEDFYPRNLAKLTLVLIAYMFSQDDGEIDKKESKALNKIMKRFKQDLTIEDYEEIINVIDHNPTLSYVSNYITDNGIKDKMFIDAYGIINNNIKLNSTYRELLKKLKHQYQGSKENV